MLPRPLVKISTFPGVRKLSRNPGLAGQFREIHDTRWVQDLRPVISSPRNARDENKVRRVARPRPG